LVSWPAEAVADRRPPHPKEALVRAPYCLALALLAGVPVPVVAHYNMLLPSRHSVKKGEEVTFTYQFGHPYEHQLFDAPRPERLLVVNPKGDRVDLLARVEKVELPAGEGKKVTGYRFRFTPAERGDYIFLLRTPPIWMEEDGKFLQDSVKVVLHVQAQKGWGEAVDLGPELTPLTRPYGLLPGTVFQAQARVVRQTRFAVTTPLSGFLVEVERYNATSPKELPADEFITRTVKTDPNGVVTTTLPEAGWWCLAVGVDGEPRERDGKKRPFEQRAILWVYVDEKPAK
jgi:uncharacterized GH25 family protein